MSTQQTVIGFENYRIKCLIGIEPHERINEQEILVDIKVEADCYLAIKTESIQKTIDYRQLAEICKDRAHQGRYQLIETYASEVLEEVMKQFKLKRAWIRVKKPAALSEADYAYVEMHREAE